MGVGHALGAVAVMLAGCGGGGRHVVELRGFEYVPAVVEARAGDTIEFVNRDIVAHTATSSVGEWDSGSLAPGARWEWTVQGSGTVEYICTLHPSMRASVEVR